MPVAGFRPVDNGAGLLKDLLPGARVTSGYRPASHPLSKANPRSWHTRSRAAVDIAPIPGMTLADVVNRVRGAGYGVIESRDEVTNPSSHATGPHWHLVIGQR